MTVTLDDVLIRQISAISQGKCTVVDRVFDGPPDVDDSYAATKKIISLHLCESMDHGNDARLRLINMDLERIWVVAQAVDPVAFWSRFANTSIVEYNLIAAIHMALEERLNFLKIKLDACQLCRTCV